MTIRYNCVKCGQLLKINDDLAGTPNKCPTCKTKFIVPSPSSAASTSDSQPNIVSKPEDVGTSGAVPVVAAASTPVAAAAKGPDAPPASSTATPTASAPAAAPAAASPPKPPADDFDPTDVLMAGGPKKAPAKAAAPEKKNEDFDPTDVLMGDGPKKAAAKPAAAAAPVGAGVTGAAPAAPAAEKKDDFDPADFLMEGKPKKAAVPAPSPAKSAPAAKKSDPAVAAVAEVPAAPAPEGDPNFDPAEFLMAEKAKAEAPPEPPKGPPGPGAPPAPRRWGARASTAPPASAAAAAAGATLAAAAPAAADPNLADMPAAQPTMVKLPQEAKREPIDIRKAIRAVGWRRWSLLALSLAFSTGLYWYLNQPKLEVPPLGQVSGVVTLDGKPLAGATVYFAPEKREYKRDKVSRGLPLRTAAGLTDAEGRYSLTYVDTVPGTFLGTNRVSVQPLLDEKGKNKVPTAWGRESKNTVDVVEGANRQFDVVMKSGK